MSKLFLKNYLSPLCRPEVRIYFKNYGHISTFIFYIWLSYICFAEWSAMKLVELIYLLQRYIFWITQLIFELKYSLLRSNSEKMISPILILDFGIFKIFLSALPISPLWARNWLYLNRVQGPSVCETCMLPLRHGDIHIK